MAAQITCHLAFSSITVASNNLQAATGNIAHPRLASVLPGGTQTSCPVRACNIFGQKENHETTKIGYCSWQIKLQIPLKP
jgi:hypothetical protein